MHTWWQVIRIDKEILEFTCIEVIEVFICSILNVDILQLVHQALIVYDIAPVIKHIVELTGVKRLNSILFRKADNALLNILAMVLHRDEL